MNNLKIGDHVKLWNGTQGTITAMVFPLITVSSNAAPPQEFHWLNIKSVNGVRIDHDKPE